MNLPPLVLPQEELTKNEIERYSRHLLLPDLGVDGQRRLKASRVLVIGAGGLGSPALLYLAAAGVGTLGIIDFDVVDESNLQRQVIHGISNIGSLKTESAKESIAEINPYVNVQLHNERLETNTAIDIISQYDLIVDGTDNFSTRYLVNDACVLAGKPYVWGSIFRFEGQVSVFWEDAPKGVGLNYRDLYPEPPPPEFAPSCSEGGVLGILCASIGSIMATEAVKLITGLGDSLLGRLMVYDALDMTYRTIKIKPAPDRKKIECLIDYDYFCGLTAPVSEINNSSVIDNISALELSVLLSSSTKVSLIDVRELTEWDIVHINGAIHIPKDNIVGGKLSGLDKDSLIVVMCKLGGRSAKVIEIMKEQGYKNLKNLEGGIISWVRDVDSELPVY
jgi:molybdopterin/thiamine biosynthesis adenylyltransferase/rhodanese-related sulfurtransferase